ncbi:MAG: T9SS type A sorting domain-containing protein [Bacteroidota bacterium]
MAPTGYENAWNICAEDTDAPDTEMIDDLVNLLQGYNNINPNQIRILGSSNGAGLANRVFIENPNAGIDIICTIVSQLNEPQYHSGSFYQPGTSTDASTPFCGYDVAATPITTRKYLSICNDNDPVIPYAGGSSAVGVNFLHAETAAYLIAQHQGYTGDQLTSGNTIGNPAITEFSYLAGTVVHIKGDARHAANSTQRSYITDFFAGIDVVLAIDGKLHSKMNVYPNPTRSTVTVHRVSSQTVSYLVFNTLGQPVRQGMCHSKMLSIDLSSLPGSIYFLKMGDQLMRIVKSE